jgi:hypothetical protein
MKHCSYLLLTFIKDLSLNILSVKERVILIFCPLIMKYVACYNNTIIGTLKNIVKESPCRLTTIIWNDQLNRRY